MKFVKIDTIVRSKLLQTGYSIHWYYECLKAATDVLRELNFDTLQNIRTVKLTVSSYGAVTLPCDFVDMVSIGGAYSDFLTPMAKRNNLNRLNNFDSTGNKITYAVPDEDLSAERNLWYFGAPGIVSGWFGIGGGTSSNSYTILRERNEIQLSGYAGTEVILSYISDGQESDSATEVHPYAQAAIEAYISWQLKQNNRSYSDGEKRNAQNEYDKQHRILRARMNDMTLSDLRRVINNSYNATLP